MYFDGDVGVGSCCLWWSAGLEAGVVASLFRYQSKAVRLHIPPSRQQIFDFALAEAIIQQVRHSLDRLWFESPGCGGRSVLNVQLKGTLP